MEVIKTAIEGVQMIRPKRHCDERGVFVETYQHARYAAAGVTTRFVQDNYSRSLQAGTIRGLHYQAAPHAQAKLVTVLAGAIYDVAVDMRPESPTFGRHIGVELTADSATQLMVPEGCAHGFCTLVPGTIVHYKVSENYVAAAEGGIRWDDPALAITWPTMAQPPTISDRDRQWPSWTTLRKERQ